MICGTGLDLLQSSDQFPHTVCCSGVGSNSIYSMTASTGCTWNVVGSSTWQRPLITDVHGARELHAPWMADHKGKSKSDLTMEVVASFCYPGDMLSAAGGCELLSTTCVKTDWKKFKELLRILSSRHLSFKTCGHVYSSCVQSAMLHASES